MPTLLEMGRLRAAAAATAAASQRSDLPPSSPQRRTSSPPPGHDDRDDDSDLPPTSSLSSVMLSRTVPNMTAFGQRQLKRVKLSAASEQDYLAICETTNIYERQNLETFAVYQLIDRLQQMTSLLEASKAEQFKKNSDVTNDVRNYSRAFLLDPETHFYTGNLTQIVVEAMRKEKVAGIPGKDAAHSATSAFQAVVSHQLSVDRSHIKSELESTLNSDADPDSRDVASVASRLLASWGLPDVPITLRLLWRIALIRKQLSDRANKGRDFWASVDKQLHELRSQPELGIYVFALQANFEEDVQTYGKLSSDVKLDPDIGPHSPKWLQRVRKLARNVENTKITNPTGKASRKRTRVQADISDDDQPPRCGEGPGEGEGDGDGEGEGEGEGQGGE
ncbi:hypothetical protein C8F01DRAFT_1234691 [Mycena amicta]|nr:hypothetical protein C8F01DRAFT_1234691 [Mycena amicta]